MRRSCPRRLRQPVGPPEQGEGEEGQLRLHHQVPRRADAAGDHLSRPPPRRRPRAAWFPADAGRHLAPGRRLRRHRLAGRLRRPVRPRQGRRRTRRRRGPHGSGSGGAHRRCGDAPGGQRRRRPEERLVRRPRRRVDRADPGRLGDHGRGGRADQQDHRRRQERDRLAVEAHPAPKYLYDLVDYHLGGVPQDPSAKTDPRDLARIDLEFAPPSGKQVTE